MESKNLSPAHADDYFIASDMPFSGNNNVLGIIEQSQEAGAPLLCFCPISCGES